MHFFTFSLRAAKNQQRQTHFLLSPSSLRHGLPPQNRYPFLFVSSYPYFPFYKTDTYKPTAKLAPPQNRHLPPTFKKWVQNCRQKPTGPMRTFVHYPAILYNVAQNTVISAPISLYSHPLRVSYRKGEGPNG
jgi:hypothetical protein